MKTSKSKMQSAKVMSHIDSTLFKSALFCMFFSVIALAVAFFLPATSEIQDIKIASASFVEPVEAKSSSDSESEAEFPFDFSSLSATVFQRSQESDRGLELYRDARSKAAVEWFYLHIAGDRKVANAILAEASKNDIPLSLAFALAYVESRFKPSAVNRNQNSSIDRGLFQLNNNSFPKLNEDEFFNPEISAKYGLQHLRFCLDLAGKEVTALAMYNAGTNRVRKNNTPRSTLNYVDAIMRYKAGLDSAFEEEIVRLYAPVVQNAAMDVAIVN